MKLAAPLLMLTLAGCATAPTRQSQPEEFKVEVSGQVRQGATQATTDCVMDGFDGASMMLTNVNIRQQRRVDGYRVDMLTGPSLLASVDIPDTGKVEMRISSVAALIVLDKERAAVTACIEKFK